jgi:hypothetical protein
MVNVKVNGLRCPAGHTTNGRSVEAWSFGGCPVGKGRSFVGISTLDWRGPTSAFCPALFGPLMHVQRVFGLVGFCNTALETLGG